MAKLLNRKNKKIYNLIIFKMNQFLSSCIHLRPARNTISMFQFIISILCMTAASHAQGSSRAKYGTVIGIDLGTTYSW